VSALAIDDLVPMSARTTPVGLTLEQVFTENAAFVWRTLKYLGVGRDDIRDASQEVFLVVHRKLGELDDGSRLRSWLYTICVRVAAAHRRRARSRREDIVPEVPQVGVEPTQQAALEAQHARAMLERALDALDDDRRAVVVLHEIEELPMSEVAAIVGCPLQTAYSRLRLARADLTRAWKRLESRRTER
jgi:RNA polymerase sigma-70 factor, ECF subfamily